MEKRKQASRTPNASRNTTARSMSERQGVRGLLNLAAAFGVREACFRFGLSHASMLFGIGRTGKLGSCFCFRFNANGPGGAPFRPAQKLRCSLWTNVLQYTHCLTNLNMPYFHQMEEAI